ncbi:MAG: hypothetical protein M3N47_00380 [Chloroflexota bacterium]|nr:hypothetical protein [Chloroflexota bacterium]
MTTLAVVAGQFDQVTTTIGVPLTAVVFVLLLVIDARQIGGRREAGIVVVAVVLCAVLGALIVSRFVVMAY